MWVLRCLGAGELVCVGASFPGGLLGAGASDPGPGVLVCLILSDIRSM